MKGLFGKAACGIGLLVSASQVFSLEASPAIFIVGLVFMLGGGLAVVEHQEEKA